MSENDPGSKNGKWPWFKNGQENGPGCKRENDPGFWLSLQFNWGCVNELYFIAHLCDSFVYEWLAESVVACRMSS